MEMHLLHLEGQCPGEECACAAGYQTRDIMPPARHVHPAVSGMEMPAPWLSEMAETLEEVMNAESLELQAIFNSDHLVSRCFMLKTVWLCSPVDHCLSGREMACHACACAAGILAGHLCIAFTQCHRRARS